MSQQARPMIASVEFHNFKVLRNATLPLAPFTLIIGPNGSGKSTVIQALQAAAQQISLDFDSVATAGIDRSSEVDVIIRWASPFNEGRFITRWARGHGPEQTLDCDVRFRENFGGLQSRLHQMRVYSLDAGAIASDVQLTPGPEIGPGGGGLPVVLDQLRDADPERFEALNKELARWLPEFDRILFATPGAGIRGLLLRRRSDQHSIKARELSQGTLLALAILTLAYLPSPPPLVCFEEPDRGIHPRLLREVRDALYRLTHPKDFGEDRDPVQVIATTHSPYLLDLYRDHPEEIVIAHRSGGEARFGRLSERLDLNEILGDVHLSEAWYSGILGGVPGEG